MVNLITSVKSYGFQDNVWKAYDSYWAALYVIEGASCSSIEHETSGVLIDAYLGKVFIPVLMTSMETNVCPRYKNFVVWKYFLRLSEGWINFNFEG